MAPGAYSIVLERDGRTVRRLNNVSEKIAAKIIALVDGAGELGTGIASALEGLTTLARAAERVLGPPPRKRIAPRRR